MTEQPHLTDRELEQYAAALKTKTLHLLPASIRDHVAECLACRKEAIFLYRVNLNLELQEAPSPAGDSAGEGQEDRGEGGERQGRTFWYRIAAGFALLVVCGAALWYVALRRGAELPPVAGENLPGVADSTLARRRARLALLAENSAPSANMEDLLASNFRGRALQVLAPRQGDTLRAPFTFAWEPSGRAPVTVRVLSNREEERLHLTTDSSRFTLPATLTPGLYYWTAEAGGSLVYAGKFYLY